MEQESSQVEENADRLTESLHALSSLAGTSFGTTSAATEAILRLIADLFGMRTTWVSRIDRSSCEMVVTAAHNEPGGCDFRAGTTHPLPDTY